MASYICTYKCVSFFEYCSMCSPIFWIELNEKSLQIKNEAVKFHSPITEIYLHFVSSNTYFMTPKIEFQSISKTIFKIIILNCLIITMSKQRDKVANDFR